MSAPDLITKEAPPVAVPTKFPRSRTWAVRHLAKFFVAPFFRNVTTTADRAKRLERWRVFCRNRETGKEIGITEVCGPAPTIGKAGLMAACARIGVRVSFDAQGSVSFKAEPLKKPESTATPAAPASPTAGP